MKKVLKRIAITLLAIVLTLAAIAGGMILYSNSYSVPEQPATAENTTGLVQAIGRSLYDPAGNRLVLRGINAGQILLQEGWMSPFALEPSKNADGTWVTDGDGNLQYPEFAEEHFRQGLAANPNLADYTFEDLIAIYRACVFTEEDFRIIADLGLNCIRLPFYWRDILNDDLERRADAFGYLDWFVENAAANNLYVILDLHGAPGSQSGYEHSGSADGEANLWHNQAYIDATVDLWAYIAEHYQEKPDLGRWIATYDIMNEPTYRARAVTTKACWEVFDQIYDAIRATGDRHVITMEGCWDFSALPDPAAYGWENVQYEYHWYNWWPDKLPYKLYYAYNDLSNLGRDYEVPVLIGEFTCFEDQQAWANQLALFDRRGYNWTVWNYKTTVTGWWTSSWGVYTCQLKFITENEETKCNVATCTYEEFIAACEKTRTENCATGTLLEVLQTYKTK